MEIEFGQISGTQVEKSFLRRDEYRINQHANNITIFFRKLFNVFVLVEIFSQMTAEGKGRVPAGTVHASASFFLAVSAHWTTTLARNEIQQKTVHRSARIPIFCHRDRKSDRARKREKERGGVPRSDRGK